MELDTKEALRYLGVSGQPEPELLAQVEMVAAELSDTLEPKYLYRVFPLERRGADIALAGAGVILTGSLAGKLLADCGQAALLGCTLGWEFDRLLEETQRRDMARAVILDACGGALVEAGCDRATEELRGRLTGRYLTDRFSPGYGDLPLALQRPICAALEAEKRLGLHVSESLMLSPVKSVTAVIGIADVPQMARIRGCEFCDMRETCTLRKRGTSCGM